MHTFFEARVDAEQRYAIKYLVRNKKSSKKLSVKLKKYMDVQHYKKTAVYKCTSDFLKAIIPQLIRLEPDVMER